MEYPMVFAINTTAVALAVVIHNWGLLGVAHLMPRVKWKNSQLVFGVLASLFLHAVEIWMFAGVIYYFHHSPSYGTLTGNFGGSYFDCIYF